MKNQSSRWGITIQRPHIVFVWSGGIKPLGGTEKMLFDHISLLKRNGYRISLVSARADTKHSNFIDDRIKVRFPNFLRKLPASLRIALFSFLATIKVIALIRDRRKVGEYVIVHPQCEEGVFISLARKMRILRAPVVCTFQGSEWIEWRTVLPEFVSGVRIYLHLIHIGLLKIIESITWHGADAVVATCEFGKRILASSYDVDSKKIKILHPYIRINPRKSLVSHDEGTTILTVANLHPRKGIKYLIESMRRIVDETNNVKLIIVGDGSLRESLERQVLELGLSRDVMFTGKLERDEVFVWYGRCDVFVLPSLYEGFGMVIAEAMAHGKPVVITNMCGIAPIVHDFDCGIVVKPKNPKQLSDALLTLIHDGITQLRMGATASRVINSIMRPESTLQMLEEAYSLASKQYQSNS